MTGSSPPNPSGAPAAFEAASRTTWLDAGLALLGEGGLPAVRLQALTERTGRTTGSFYHHFRSMAVYLEALAGHFADQFPRAMLTGGDATDPQQRLAQMWQVALGQRIRRVDAAMRAWAASSPVAADAVRRSDALVLGALCDIFEAMGCDRSESQVRAYVLMAAGLARIHTPWPLDEDFAAAVARVMTGPV